MQSITKASEELFLTQPAVSIQLKKFQEQFEIPLTEVVGRQLYVTPFGKEIAEAARKILDEAQQMEYKSLAFQGKIAGRIKVSIVSTGKYVMPYFLAGFVKQNKGIDLTIDVTNKATVIEGLEKNKVDFGLVSLVPKSLNLEYISLMPNELYLVGGTVLEKERITPVDQLLENYPMLYREMGSATRNAMEDFIETLKLPFVKKMELTSNEALKQAVIAGLGYSIMPLIGLNNSLKNNELKIIPYPNLPIVTTWNLVWLKSKKLSPVAKEYITYLKKNKDHIVAAHFSWMEEVKATQAYFSK